MQVEYFIKSQFESPAVDYSLHYITLQLPRKPYALVSGKNKKSLQLRDGRSKGVEICISVPVSDNSFNASCIHELKTKGTGQIVRSIYVKYIIDKGKNVPSHSLYMQRNEEGCYRVDPWPE